MVHLNNCRGYVVRIEQINGKQVREYEHRYIWSQHFGDIPDGYVIHHIDGNRQNNDIDNLRCIESDYHKNVIHSDCKGGRPRITFTLQAAKRAKKIENDIRLYLATESLLAQGYSFFQIACALTVRYKTLLKSYSDGQKHYCGVPDRLKQFEAYINRRAKYETTANCNR